MPENWLLPTGHKDPGDSWGNETNAYDEDPSTYAGTSLDIGTWSGFLYLILASAVQSNKLRFHAWCHSLDLIDIDAKIDGVWVDVYQGTIKNNVWLEKTFTDGLVDQVRIRFYRDPSSAISTKRINEVACMQTVKPGLAVAVPVGPMILGGGTGFVIGLTTGKPKYAVIGAAVGASIGLVVTVKPTREQLDDFPLLYPEEVT